jgi:hypothetical protein
MHMLHTRRKAEIEILSAADPDPTPNSLLTLDEDQTREHHQIESVSPVSTFASRFINYLHGKITEFLEIHT